MSGLHLSLIYSNTAVRTTQNLESVSISQLQANLLTYTMVQSPSWEANWFATSYEIPRIFMEPEGSLPHSQASANPRNTLPRRSEWGE